MLSSTLAALEDNVVWIALKRRFIWNKVEKLHFPQLQGNDCGSAAVKCLTAVHGWDCEYYDIDNQLERSSEGADLYSLNKCLQEIGIETFAFRMESNEFCEGELSPCIIHLDRGHFIVVKRIFNNEVWISDPAGPAAERITTDQFKDSVLGQKILVAGIYAGQRNELTYPTKSDEVFDSGSATGRALMRPFAKTILVICALTILLSLSGLVMPIAIAAIVGRLGGDGVDEDFVVALLMLLIILSGKEVFALLRGNLAVRFAAYAYIRIVGAFLKSILHLPAERFFRQGSGETLARIEDYRRIQTYASETILSAIFSLFFIGFVSAAIVGISGVAGLMFVGGLVGFLAVCAGFMSRRRALEFQRFREDADARGIEIRMLQGFLQFKALGIEENRVSLWHEANSRLANVSVELGRLEQSQSFWSSLFFNAFFLSTITILLLSEGNDLSPALFVVVAVLILQARDPLKALVAFWRDTQDVQLAAFRITLFDRFERERSGERRLPHNASGVGIAFENVSFAYQKNAGYVLKNFSVDIAAGDTVALVGSSGSGKSTLLSLILRFFEPNTGGILINGILLTDYTSADFRRMIGSVLQDGSIFDGSIAENVLAGSPLDSNFLDELLRDCKCEKFIDRLPNGVDTLLGSEGLALSGGEKQRLLIARALYRKPSLLLLDEATSALDAETEWLVVSAIKKWAPSATKIISAHRLSTIRDADKIIVMDHGEICEEGDHHHLLKKNGAYANLINKQAS